MPDPGSSPLQPSLPVTGALAGVRTRAAGSVPDKGPSGDLIAPRLEEGASVRQPSAALQRILCGPSGLGTAGLHLARRAEPPAPAEPAELAEPAEGTPIPGLYHHPVAPPDPVRVEEVSHRIKAWAVDEVQAFPLSGRTSSTDSPSAATWSPATRTPPPWTI